MLQHKQTLTLSTVIATIENFAALIQNAAHDSVVEKNDYSIIDNVQALQYVYANYAQHTSIASLAAAALNSNLDTAVRENIHAQLTFIN
jgi:Ribonuclease G/E